MTTTSGPPDPARTLDSIGDAVLSIDAAGRVTYLNPAAEAMTGWRREEAAGHPLDDVFRIVDFETREAVSNPLHLALTLGRTVGLTPNCVLLRRDGSEVPIEDSAAPIRGEDRAIVGAVIVFRDVGAALETSRQMATLAQHDALTGLPNRVLLNDRLTEAVALRQRHHRQLAVCFIDVDGFKGINDSFGHTAGDAVLRSIANHLTTLLRQSDTVSRYSGDEFVVVLSEIERAEDAVVVARKLLEAVAGPHRVGALTVAVTASLGLAVFPEHGHDAVALIANADAAMYEAKRNASGTCRLYDIGTHARALDRLMTTAHHWAAHS